MNNNVVTKLIVWVINSEGESVADTRIFASIEAGVKAFEEVVKLFDKFRPGESATLYTLQPDGIGELFEDEMIMDLAPDIYGDNEVHIPRDDSEE